MQERKDIGVEDKSPWADLVGLRFETRAETTATPRLESDLFKDEAFRTKRLADNIVRLRLIARIFIGLVAWFGSLNTVARFTGTREYSYFSSHFVLYSTVLLLNIGTIVALRLRHKSKQVRELPFYERLIVIYIVAMMVLGALISLTDQPDFGHIMLFTMILFICSAFFLTEPREIILAIGVSSAILVGGLTFMAPSDQVRQIYYQELLSYLPIAFAISRVVYTTYGKNYRSALELEHQIEKNRKLNQRLQAANDHLGTLAFVDELTGIANRRGLHFEMEKIVSGANPEVQFAAIMIDIDYFKEYNDHYGHSEGDRVLSQLALMFEKVAEGNSGHVSRWGGEEFVFIARDKSKEDIIRICELIRSNVEALAIPHARSPVSKQLTVSQGACDTVSYSYEDMEACLRRADNALYLMKAQGRNGYVHLPRRIPEERLDG